MAKSSLEKQIEKQMKLQKQLAERERREADKREQNEKQRAADEARRTQASSIVNGQPLVEGFRIMDRTAEEVLLYFLNKKINDEYHVSFDYDIFPDFLNISIPLELEKLTQYGMISGVICWLSGGMFDLLPPAISYFEDKEAALKRKREREEKINVGNITNYGNMVFGDVSNSTLSVDNSIHEIERMIEERGGEDIDDLKDILYEVKELVENMDTSHSVPKQKKLFKRITEHLAKHGWFYGAIIQLLGTEVIQIIGS